MSGVRPGWWRGRKVARLPETGVLLVATDLQGNWRDYCALKAAYKEEQERGNEPVLLLCGDMVHGPGPGLSNPKDWPEFLGAFYKDESARLILDLIEFSKRERTVCLLGNHEHAHIGGPVVSKFHADEAAVLNRKLGDDRERVCSFLASLPLIAVARCGAAFTHGAPGKTEAKLEDFEALRYDGYDEMSINSIHESTTVGSLLWSRYADPQQARAFLAAATLSDRPSGFVAFGHDVVRDGFEKIGDEQICVSTSFGCEDMFKHYLRLDLSQRYASVHDLEVGRELRRLYPEA